MAPHCSQDILISRHLRTVSAEGDGGLAHSDPVSVLLSNGESSFIDVHTGCFFVGASVKM